jgi:hypothetical protein
MSTSSTSAHSGELDQHAISDRSLSVVSASSKRTTLVAHHTGSGDHAFVARRARLKEDLARERLLRANSPLAFSRSWNGIECGSSLGATRTPRQESLFRKPRTIVQLLVHAQSHNRASCTFMHAANPANTTRSKCLKSA